MFAIYATSAQLCVWVWAHVWNVCTTSLAVSCSLYSSDQHWRTWCGCLLCAGMYIHTTDSTNLLAIFGITWASTSILLLLATTFFVLFLSFNRPKWWTSLTGLLDPLWSLLTCPTQTQHRYGNIWVSIVNHYSSLYFTMYYRKCRCILCEFN